ncbi:MAG: hypothetical protein P8L71_13995 [Flavobacteriales bacterium]|nr:hypothetical protein [Flavobacteriales bacterium]
MDISRTYFAEAFTWISISALFLYLKTINHEIIYEICPFVLLVAVMSSCTSMNKTMREPNARVEFEREDFTMSSQVSASSTTTKIIGIDWKRLTKKETGTVEGFGGFPGLIDSASIPVIGGVLTDATSSYALYNLMSENPGYDVVFYPQYETKVERPILGIGFLKTVTTVKVTARLGSIK